jgi:DNA-binding GntR family transcriptional regulator
LKNSKKAIGANNGAARSFVDRIHDELHRMITEGKLGDGERLVIDRLARQFGTSLIPVREALARLKAEGLITMEHNKGYRVAPAPSTDQLRWLFEGRVVIETGAVEIALARGEQLDLTELRDINQQIAMGTYGTTFDAFREFVLLNERFHVQLVALARNEVLNTAYGRMGYHQQITRPIFGRGVGDIHRIIDEHWRIIEEVERGHKAGARKAIATHVMGGWLAPAVMTADTAAVVPAGKNDGKQLRTHVRASKRLPVRTAASRGRTKAP